MAAGIFHKGDHVICVDNKMRSASVYLTVGKIYTVIEFTPERTSVPRASVRIIQDDNGDECTYHADRFVLAGEYVPTGVLYDGFQTP